MSGFFEWAWSKFGLGGNSLDATLNSFDEPSSSGSSGDWNYDYSGGFGSDEPTVSVFGSEPEAFRADGFTDIADDMETVEKQNTTVWKQITLADRKCKEITEYIRGVDEEVSKFLAAAGTGANIIKRDVENGLTKAVSGFGWSETSQETVGYSKGAETDSKTIGTSGSDSMKAESENEGSGFIAGASPSSKHAAGKKDDEDWSSEWKGKSAAPDDDLDPLMGSGSNGDGCDDDPDPLMGSQSDGAVPDDDYDPLRGDRFIDEDADPLTGSRSNGDGCDDDPDPLMGSGSNGDGCEPMFYKQGEEVYDDDPNPSTGIVDEDIDPLSYIKSDGGTETPSSSPGSYEAAQRQRIAQQQAAAAAKQAQERAKAQAAAAAALLSPESKPSSSSPGSEAEARNRAYSSGNKSSSPGSETEAKNNAYKKSTPSSSQDKLKIDTNLLNHNTNEEKVNTSKAIAQGKATTGNSKMDEYIRNTVNANTKKK